VPREGGDGLADAGTTTLSLLGADGRTIAVSAYGLGFIEYDRRLVHADERMQGLAKRVAETGAPYESPRIRLVVVPRDDASPAPPWPGGVPVPPKNGDLVRVSDLAGWAARAAIAAFPNKPGGRWNVFRTLDAELLAVAWRYLLPDE
jgi:hypothetical protein